MDHQGNKRLNLEWVCYLLSKSAEGEKLFAL